MRISTEQLSQMRHLRNLAFEDRLLEHLRKHHARQLADHPDGVVRSFIRRCMDRAKRSYGLESEQAIACYAQLPLLLGPTFELNSAYAAIPALLGRRSFNQNTRAKMALSMAYHVRPAEK